MVNEDTVGKFQFILGIVLLIGSIIVVIYGKNYIKETSLFNNLQGTGINILQISGDKVLTLFYVLAAIIIVMIILLIYGGFSKILNNKIKQEE